MQSGRNPQTQAFAMMKWLKEEGKVPRLFFRILRYQASVMVGSILHLLAQWGCSRALSTRPQGRQMVRIW